MTVPDLCLEEGAWAKGYRLVAGIDEAGRGAWAGPVAAAAVILPPACPELLNRLDGVRDSKMLSPGRRDRLFDVINKEAVAIGVGMVGPDDIVEKGIAVATRQAMADAISHLSPHPDYLLIDWVRLPEVDLPQESFRKGDQKCLSIAAASIIAKVTRDRLMIGLAEKFPGYEFQQHKGYGTRLHRKALAEKGVTPLHRHTWKPFQDLEKGDH